MTKIEEPIGNYTLPRYSCHRARAPHKLTSQKIKTLAAPAIWRYMKNSNLI